MAATNIDGDTPMNNVIEYLQIVSRMSKNLRAPTIEGIVLQHGKPFTPPIIPRPQGIRKGKNKACYMNSYRLAMITGWTYVEGFAVFSDQIPIPLQHAWVIDEKNNVIETTWKTSGFEYYGIPFDMSFIHEVMFETRRYGVLDPCSDVLRKKYYS
jgi:hypothetical protein